MPATNGVVYPKLRNMLDAQPVDYAGQRYLLLRDMLELTSGYLMVPRPLAPILSLCDGSHDHRELQAIMAVRYGVRVSQDEISGLIQALEQALMLDNEQFLEAEQAALTVYRQAPFRPLSCAPHVYPAEPEALRSQLNSYLEVSAAGGDGRPKSFAGRGLISPHIDYARGGPVYADVWKQAEEAARNADLVLIFGTDHYGLDRFSLTRQNYATPYGVLETDQHLVNRLAEALGEQAAFSGEIRHRKEHSVELAAVWLHHVREGRPVDLVPVLCGSFYPFINGDEILETDPLVKNFITTLKSATAGKQVLTVAAADLAHVGPAFGGEPLTDGGWEVLRTADERLIQEMLGGSPKGFIGEIQQVQDQFNVCGVSPIYLTLAALAPTQGVLAGYDTCPADPTNTSVVTICGMLLE